MVRPGVDLVCVNYKTPDDLLGFVRSVHKYEPTIPYNLVIINVDPGPQDDAAALNLLNEDLSGRSDYVRTGTNVGYSGACNLAATRGDHEVIAFFNADTRLTEGVVDECYAALVSHDDWAVLGPRQVDQRERVTHGGIFGSLAQPRLRGWKQKNGDEYADVREAVTVSGSAYFVKRFVWDELTHCSVFRDIAPEAEGGFLPTPHYYEETWFSYHAQAHGWKIIYYGSACMIHKWHQASPRGGWADQQVKRSRAMFREACDLHGIEHD